MEALAFYGKPPTRSGKRRCWAFEKILEVYIQDCSSGTEHYLCPPSKIFHLDLSSYNILIGPDTGAIAGVIDWEMTGFR